VLRDFLLKQYEYTRDGESIIGVTPGNVVIDCRACWGDSALFFANWISWSYMVKHFRKALAESGKYMFLTIVNLLQKTPNSTLKYWQLEH